jgi:branched-subunit amino acid aminotransferase/4-amino-4-deoxychorismate lyase
LAGTWELRDGRIVFRGESASITAASQGLPAGAYTTLRTYQGDRVVRLGQHVRRLIDSARIQGSAASLDEADVRRLLAEALRAQRQPASDLTVTPPSESKLRLTFAPPSLFVSVEPLEPLPESYYRDGVWCVTVPMHRDDPAAKDTRFIATAAAAYQALPPGAHEGLMVSEDGSILEGLSSNFFAVLDGVLHTEDKRALGGITRSIVLELAQGLVPVSLTAVRVSDLPRVSECFLTSVSREILPVARVDSVMIGSRAPGPLSSKAMERFRLMAEREASSVSLGDRSATS